MVVYLQGGSKEVLGRLEGTTEVEQTCEPYKKFAKMVDSHLDGILAYCDKKVPLVYIEGTNLKAKNIIRRTYGYRDKEYMKLKIIQGCSSIGVFRPYPYVTHYNPG